MKAEQKTIGALLDALKACITEPGAAARRGLGGTFADRRFEAINEIARAAIARAGKES